MLAELAVWAGVAAPLSARKLGYARAAVSLWSRRLKNVEAAKARGIVGATDGLGTAVEGADLVVLSTPVGAMATVLLNAQGAGLSPDALITDVGSVKAAVHRSLRPLLARSRAKFIGSHPMAGSEQTGVEAASADLFQDALCFVTDDEAVGEPWLNRLEGFWQGVGCKVGLETAEKHDDLVARISHFPHMMAAATAKVALEADPVIGACGGGGLRDTTRVAGGDPEMWAEIAMENREALAPVLRQSIHEMSEMLAMLEKGDQEAVRSWLGAAKTARDAAKEHTENFRSLE